MATNFTRMTIIGFLCYSLFPVGLLSKFVPASECFLDSTYIFVDDEANFGDAEDTCRNDFEGVLASPNTATEYGFIIDFAGNELDINNDKFWIGVRRDTNAEHPLDPLSFYFSDGTLILEGDFGSDSRSTPWRWSNPNNEGNEPCVEVRGGLWNDRSCGRKLPFVCEVLCNGKFTPLPTVNPTLFPTTPSPTAFPSISIPTEFPTFPTPTSFPTTPNPTAFPTTTVTDFPTQVPTKSPITKIPTNAPSKAPTSLMPTESPTVLPTESPTVNPTAFPSIAPTLNPTILPTIVPTVIPTESPTTTNPTENPTISPFENPTMVPTETPTAHPVTESPTLLPSKSPISFPTTIPSSTPTMLPSEMPLSIPSVAPSKTPTTVELTFPTVPPVDEPTIVPTSSPEEDTGLARSRSNSDIYGPLGLAGTWILLVFTISCCSFGLILGFAYVRGWYLEKFLEEQLIIERDQLKLELEQLKAENMQMGPASL